MQNERSSLLVGLILSLRIRLIAASESSDQAAVKALFTTFGELLEASYVLSNRELSVLLENLESSARDTLTGVSWKGKVPSEEEIISTLDRM